MIHVMSLFELCCVQVLRSLALCSIAYRAGGYVVCGFIHAWFLGFFYEHLWMIGVVAIVDRNHVKFLVYFFVAWFLRVFL